MEKQSKLSHKMLIISTKVIPILLAFSFAICCILVYCGIDITAAHYFSGISILTIMPLYQLSYVLKFCEYHRIPLHYIIVCNTIACYDTYVGIPVKDMQYLIFQLSIFILFVLLYIYLKFK